MAGTPARTRPLTDEDKQELLIPIVSGLQELVFGAPGLFIDRPGFIANPDPMTGLATTVRNLQRFNCRSWALSDKSEYSSLVNEGNAELCGPYLDSLGENPDPGSVAPPFTGGQCPVNYNASWESRRFNGSLGAYEWRSFSFTGGALLGPLTIDNTLSGFTCFGDDKEDQYTLVSANGTRVLIGAGGCSDITPGYRNLSLTRQDGMPDNCGNPDSEIRPPSTVTPSTPLPPSISINVPGFGPVDVTLTLDPSGNPVFCVDQLETCFTVDIGGSGGGGGGGGPNTTPGEAGPGGDTGSGGNAEGNADDGDELVGVLVQVMESPDGANRFDNNSQQPFRGIGYVRMGYAGRLGTDVSGGTVISPQFFHAQQPGLTHWAVNANVGFNLRVTPYYRTIQS